MTENLHKILSEERDLARGQMTADLLAAEDYDAGFFNDYGGGNVQWWLNYLRAEIGRCNDYWRSLIEHYNGKVIGKRYTAKAQQQDSADPCDLHEYYHHCNTHMKYCPECGKLFE